MKYSKTSMSILIFSFICFSCKESSIKINEEKPVYEEQYHPTDFSLDSGIDIHSVAGIYQGIFPCTDCDGMEHMLFLRDNYTYKQAYVNVDSNKVYSTSTGDWKIVGNRIILSKENKYYISFNQRNDSLFAVDIDLIPIKNPGIYALGKQKYAGEDPYWKEERKKGITFAGRGSDPSWILNIKNDILYFKFQDHKNGLISEKEKTNSDDKEITYHLSTDNKPWSVTIKNNFCKNGLSDDMFEYEVVVHYNGYDYTGCGINLKNE